MRFLLHLLCAVFIACVGLLSPVGSPRASLAAQLDTRLVRAYIEMPTVMAVDPSGNVYAAVYGQCGLYDSIVKLAPDDRLLERLEFTFGSRPGQVKGITGLAADAAGNIYVADLLNNRVQKLSPRGTPLAVWQGGPGRPGFSHPQGLALGPHGDIYVLDANASRVVKLAPDGAAVATLSTGYTSEYGSDFPLSLLRSFGAIGRYITLFLAGVAVDAHGNLYVATGDDLRKISPTGVPLAIWKPPAARGFRQLPQQVALDAAGDIYTTGDLTPIHERPGTLSVIGGGGVDKLSPAGKPLALWNRTGRAPGHFGNPVGLGLDGAGNLYVADATYDRIDRLSLDGTPRAIWGDTRTSPLPPSRFGGFVDRLGVGATGRLLVSILPDRVDQISPAGRIVATWKPKNHGATFSAQGLTTDRAGNVYLADGQDGGVVELNPAGRLLHHWKLPRSRDKVFGGTTAPQVDDIAVAPWGSIYVSADNGLWSMRRGSGRWTRLVRGSNEANAGHSFSDLAVDPRGRIYAIDGRRIDVLSSDGKQLGRRVSSEACTGVTFNPTAIAVGPRGTLYVADGDPVDQIVKFSSSGRILARWGSRGDGLRQFRFDFVGSLAVGHRGNVFVIDDSRRIRKFSPAGRLLATWR